MVKSYIKGVKWGNGGRVEWGRMTPDKAVMEALSEEVTFEQRPE